MPGIADRRFEDVLQPPGAALLEQQGPGSERAVHDRGE